MVTGLTAEQVCRELGNDRETNLREMKSFLRSHDVWVAEERIPVMRKEELPALYKTIGQVYAGLDKWSMYIITSYEEAEKYIGRKADKNRKIYNGMIRSYFYQFMGPKPPKRTGAASATGATSSTSCSSDYPANGPPGNGSALLIHDRRNST